MNIVSWNCKGLDSVPIHNKAITTLAKDLSADVFCLIESKDDSSNVVNLLSKSGFTYMEICSSVNDDIKIFAKDCILFTPSICGERWCSMDYKDSQERIIKFFFVHLCAKNSTNEITRHYRNSLIATEIKNSSQSVENIFIVGDFNENPYESTLCSYNCFNGIFPSMKSRAENYVIRAYCDKEYFINPSWDIFTNNDDVAGSFYFKNNAIDCLGWNVLDQVIMSFNAYENIYEKKTLKVIPKTTNIDLLDNGIPNKNNYSDHLPISFNIRR